jgi:hypothetical protein
MRKMLQHCHALLMEPSVQQTLEIALTFFHPLLLRLTFLQY